MSNSDVLFNITLFWETGCYTSCPKDHLTMYVRKMSTYANDHQVFIHYFQDSLTDAALKWYMNLDRAEI